MSDPEQDGMRERAEEWYRQRFHYADDCDLSGMTFEDYIAFARQEVERAVEKKCEEIHPGFFEFNWLQADHWHSGCRAALAAAEKRAEEAEISLMARCKDIEDLMNQRADRLMRSNELKAALAAERAKREDAEDAGIKAAHDHLIAITNCQAEYFRKGFNRALEEHHRQGSWPKCEHCTRYYQQDLDLNRSVRDVSPYDLSDPRHPARKDPSGKV